MSLNANACKTPDGGADSSVSLMTGEIAVPRSKRERVYEAPWQNRAFGMAASLSEAGPSTWNDFREDPARAIREKGQLGVDEYCLRWMDALEDVLRPHARNEVF